MSSCLTLLSALPLAMVGLVLFADPAAAASSANPHLLIHSDELARLVGTPALRIVDLGADPDKGAAAYRAGHIPGAVYLTPGGLDDPEANANGLPIRPDKAAALFGRLGIDEDTTVVAYDDPLVVVYCQSGVRAAHRYFVLRLLGYAKIKNYDGSWNERGNDPSLPVAR